MKAPGIVQRHPELRWLVSVAVIVAVIASLTSSLSGVFRDQSTLRVTSPDQLVSEVRTPHEGGYTGTIVTRVDLDLPGAVTAAVAAELPVGGALLSGLHSMRYWYGDAQRQRVAIVGQNSEQDVFRDGSRLMLWDTQTRVLETHTVSGSGSLPMGLAAAAALTPPQLAERILDVARDATGSTTTLRSGAPVAGRDTYELVIVPTSDSSLIGSVHIQVDGLQAVPLAVQIYPRDGGEPVVDVSFSSIDFLAPSERNFTFTPPDDAVLARPTPFDLSAVTTSGTGWLQILHYSDSRSVAPLLKSLFGRSMRPVKGSWGSGRLFTGTALSVLVTSKGQVVAGAVDPSVLYGAVA